MSSEAHMREAPTRILMEAHEGRVVSLFFENGFLQECTRHGAEVRVICPAADVPGFVEKYGMDGVSWVTLPVHRELTKVETALMKLGRKLSMAERVGSRRMLWSSLEMPLAAKKGRDELAAIRDYRPDVVFSPYISEAFGRRLVAVAQAQGVPTVGNLLSWDNTYRPLKARPSKVTCWSDRARRELIKCCAYEEQEIEVTGAPAFDPYFQEDGVWSREKLCEALGLESQRPIILYASLGQFRPFMDETGTFAALCEALDSGLIPGDPQVVLRFHPMSRMAYFERFLGRKDLVVSRFTGYVPGMMWTPTRDEVILAGNLMRHADVCISPGSTMTIEPAIFDTPTILPVVNLYTDTAYTDFFRQYWINSHFQEIIERDWVPVVRTAHDLGTATRRALEEPSWYRQGRAAIRDTILGPLDGRATSRLAKCVVDHRGASK